MKKRVLLLIILILPVISFNSSALLCGYTTGGGCAQYYNGKAMLSSYPYTGIADVNIIFSYYGWSSCPLFTTYGPPPDNLPQWRVYTTKTFSDGSYFVGYNMMCISGGSTITIAASKSGYSGESGVDQVGFLMYPCLPGTRTQTVNFFLMVDSSTSGGTSASSLCDCYQEGICIPVNDGRVCDGCNYIKAPSEQCNDFKDNNCDGSIDENCEIKIIEKGLLDIFKANVNIKSCIDNDNDGYYVNCYPYDCNDNNKNTQIC